MVIFTGPQTSIEGKEYTDTKVCAVGAVYKNDNPLHFRSALESVFDQVGIDFDTRIVVDGVIGDDLKHVLDDFPQIYVTQLPNSIGLGLALGEVFKQEIYDKYDIAIRFDADDINYPGRFLSLVDAIVNEDYDLIGSHMYEINESSQIIGARRVPLSTSKIKICKSFFNPFNHPATAFKVPVLKAVGGYRHCYFHEDWFLWLHFIKSGFSVGNLNQYLVGFRVNEGTIDRRFGDQYRKHEVAFYIAALSNGLLNPVLGCIGLGLRQLSKLLGRGIFRFLYRVLRKII
jgi:hypothetical protein